MTDDTYDPNRLMADLEQNVAAAKGQAATVAAIEGWGEAGGGRVKVCVGPSGALKNVELDPRAMRMASLELAESILEAARAGQEAVAEQVREVYGTGAAAGGLDVAAMAQGNLDVSALIEARLDKARAAMRARR